MVHTEFIFNIETKSSILFLFDFLQNTNQYLQLFLFIIFHELFTPLYDTRYKR